MKNEDRENYICMSYIKSMEVLMSVRRIYVEKKKPYAVQAKELREELLSYLGISTVTGAGGRAASGLSGNSPYAWRAGDPLQS